MNNSLSVEIDGFTYYFSKEKYEGGNGVVYFLSCQDCDKEYAIKIFKTNRMNESDYQKDKIQKRYERFKAEIDFLKNNKIDGVIPIINWHFPDELTFMTDIKKLDKCAYYIMPKGKPLKIKKISHMSPNFINQTLTDFLIIAKTIKKLHEKGVAHRDIKPDNIIYLNGEPYLSDFGLIWEANSKNLTEIDERLGPYKIMPPELESREILGFDNYLPEDLYLYSDVYLFGKVLWMALRGDEDGFKGEYRRGETRQYLDFYEKGYVPCFEPIHQLLEMATKENYSDRCDIENVINYLEKQIEFNKGNLIREKEHLNFATVTKREFAQPPDAIEMHDINRIYKYIMDNKKNMNVQINGENKNLNFNLTNCMLHKGGSLHFTLKFEGNNFEIYLLPKVLIIDKEWHVKLTLKDSNELEQNYKLFNSSKMDKPNSFYLN